MHEIFGVKALNDKESSSKIGFSYGFIISFCHTFGLHDNIKKFIPYAISSISAIDILK